MSKLNPLRIISFIAKFAVLLVIVAYLESGLVPRLPTAVLAASLMVLASVSMAVGLILDMVTLQRREAKRLRYLSLSAPPPPTGTNRG